MSDNNQGNSRNILTVLILTQVVISGTYLMVKIALREFSPLALGLVRFLLAGGIFLGLLLLRRQLRLPEKADRAAFLWLAILAVPLNQGLFLYAMKYAWASHGALFYSTTPIMVLCLSCLCLSERPTRLKVAGIALGFAGLLLVLSDQGLSFSGKALTGDLLLFLAVLTWAVYTIISKRLLARYSPLYVTGAALGLGSLLFIPIGMPWALRQDFGGVSHAGWGALLYITVLTSVFGYLIWSWGLSRLEASKVAVVSNFQPVIAALLSWAFLHEPLTVRFFAGTAVVIAGVLLTERG